MSNQKHPDNAGRYANESRYRTNLGQSPLRVNYGSNTASAISRNTSPGKISSPQKKVTLVVPEQKRHGDPDVQIDASRVDFRKDQPIFSSPKHLDTTRDSGHFQQSDKELNKKIYNPDEDLFHISLRGLVGDFGLLPYAGKKSVRSLFTSLPLLNIIRPLYERTKIQAWISLPTS